MPKTQTAPPFAFTVNPRSPVAVYAQLENQVLFAVASGRLAPGDTLPAGRTVAESTQTNVNTVLKAYRDLEIMGVLETRRGSGCVIAPGAVELAREHVGDTIGARVAQVAREAHAGGILYQDLAAAFRDAYNSTEALY